MENRYLQYLQEIYRRSLGNYQEVSKEQAELDTR